MATVHIIGGGVSGLAAATQLAASNIPVKLYEATSHAGGRARSSLDAALGSIDHGLHLIGPEARSVFAYLKRIGAGDSIMPVKSPWRLPTAPLLDYLDIGHAVASADEAMSTATAAENQLMDAWLPSIARTLLHTPIANLSSKALRRALWQRLRHGRHGTRMYVPRHSLSDSFITPALSHLEYYGGSVYFSHALKGLEWADGRVSSLTFARKKVALMADDVLILATPAAFTQSLLPSVSVSGDTHASLTLHYAVAHREAHGSVSAPLAAPVDVLRYDDGHIRAMTRVADGQWHSEPALLAHRMWRWLQRQHPYLETIAMPPYAVWREKRAGHVLTPDRQVNIGSLPPRVLLAGDWLGSHTPASLESAVSSGHLAADAAAALIPRFGERRQAGVP